MAGAEEGEGAGSARSRHPTDLLIRELIDTKRPATEAEIQAILDRMAQVPFNQRVVRVPPEVRRLSYQGQTLGNHAPSLVLHLIQRVVKDRQWAFGVTEQEYLTDLREAIRNPAARLVIYERRGGAIAAVLSPTSLPPTRLGSGALPEVFGVYSAERGRLISGYQVSSIATVNLPGDARWLS